MLTLNWLYNMNKIIRYGIFILIVLVYAEYTYATRKTLEEEDSKPHVNANVDKAKVTIGDKINYKITVDFPEGIEVLPPEIKDEVGGLTVEDFGIEESMNEKGGITQEIWCVLETFNTGSYIIPALDIKYKMKPETEEAVVKTPEVFIEVVTTLDENASDVRGIKPPVAIKKSYFRIYIIIAKLKNGWLILTIVIKSKNIIKSTLHLSKTSKTCGEKIIKINNAMFSNFLRSINLIIV